MVLLRNVKFVQRQLYMVSLSIDNFIHLLCSMCWTGQEQVLSRCCWSRLWAQGISKLGKTQIHSSRRFYLKCFPSYLNTPWLCSFQFFAVSFCKAFNRFSSVFRGSCAFYEHGVQYFTIGWVSKQLVASGRAHLATRALCGSCLACNKINCCANSLSYCIQHSESASVSGNVLCCSASLSTT
jgi:hypothetical protein